MSENNPSGSAREEYYAIRTETVSELRKMVESLKSTPETGKNSQLLAEIRKLETELKRLKKTKRYGLVWDTRKAEEFEKESRNALPVLEEDINLIISDDSEKPQNLIIEGDNFHALAALSYTHKGLVDVIYIDPPYNTGNKDFVYNDCYVDKEDDFRHSKWLSFMEKRLRIARDLMKKTGVIFISIDDNEQAQLKMLCNEVLGEENSIGQMIWSAGRKNDSRFISESHEYVLCYARNMQLLVEKDWKFREKKDGLGAIYKEYSKLVKKYGTDFRTIETELKDWYAGLKSDHPAKEHRHYCRVDEKGIYFPADISWPGGGGPKYQVLHPETLKSVVIPARGWVFGSPERMQEVIELGQVHFGEDETSVPCLKTYLKNREYQVPHSVFYKDGRGSTKRLREILGREAFGNPKDDSVIQRLISFVPTIGKDSLILDFFAGSGTTGHAVLQLNKEDGGNRRFILCSNRENTAENPNKNLCRDVCYERVKRVSQGYSNTKGETVEGLGGNLRYFKTAFVPHSKSTDDLRHAFVDRCSDLLRIKEDCFDAVPGYSGDAFRAYSGNGKNLAVLFDPSDLSELKNYLEKTSGPVIAYVFAIAQEPFVEELAKWSNRLVLEPIPDGILSSYRKIYGI